MTAFCRVGSLAYGVMSATGGSVQPPGMSLKLPPCERTQVTLVGSGQTAVLGVTKSSPQTRATLGWHESTGWPAGGIGVAAYVEKYSVPSNTVIGPDTRSPGRRGATGNTVCGVGGAGGFTD